ncbi:hypothetical protein TSUD_161690 [Trifolium subterraneum]|uniref:Uncharacterized protein n=1 Tax=Trifolium subterraneum TaxID=3900 RepID=A0A2Z6MAV8_TRISU|nr:hypothetical protein TSUD_161690 [Trifolium subterraneum]
MKKERRVGWKFYSVGPESYPMAALTWIRKDQRAKESIDKELATWTGIELLGLVLFNDSNWIMKKGVGIVDHINLKEIELGQCLLLCELGQTLDFMDLAKCDHIIWVQEEKLCAGMALFFTLLTHLLSTNDSYSVLQGGEKLHGNAHYAERMCEYMVIFTIQVDDDLVRGYTEEVEIMFNEQFSLITYLNSFKVLF